MYGAAIWQVIPIKYLEGAVKEAERGRAFTTRGQTGHMAHCPREATRGFLFEESWE